MCGGGVSLPHLGPRPPLSEAKITVLGPKTEGPTKADSRSLGRLGSRGVCGRK